MYPQNAQVEQSVQIAFTFLHVMVNTVVTIISLCVDKEQHPPHSPPPTFFVLANKQGLSQVWLNTAQRSHYPPGNNHPSHF